MTGFTADRAHLASQKPLTVTQAGVAACVLDAMTNTEIAAAMGRSRPTIERHVERLLRIFGARNRVDLALKLDRYERAAVPALQRPLGMGEPLSSPQHTQEAA